MNSDLMISLAIGVVVGSLIFIALRRMIPVEDRPLLKAIAIGSYGVGIAITWWLYTNPQLIAQAMGQVFPIAIAIVVAMLVAVLIFWRRPH